MGNVKWYHKFASQPILIVADKRKYPAQIGSIIRFNANVHTNCLQFALVQ